MLDEIKEHIQKCDMAFFEENIESVLQYRDEYGNDAILLAYLYGQNKVMDYLLSCNKNKYTVKNNYGYSILHIASMRKDMSIINGKYFKESKLHRYEDWKTLGSLLSDKKWSDGFNTAGKVIGGIFRIGFALAGLGENESDKMDRRAEEYAEKKDREEEFKRKYNDEVTKFTSKYTKEFFENYRDSLVKENEKKNKELEEKEKQKNNLLEGQLQVEVTKLKENHYKKLLSSSGYKKMNAPKDEFETTEAYKNRLVEAEKLKNNIDEKIKTFEIDYKEDINKKRLLLEEQYEQDLDTIRNEIKKINLEKDFYDDYIFLESPFEVKKLKCQYDADTQYFDIEIVSANKQILNYKLQIPLKIAKDVKELLTSNNVKESIVKKDDGTTEKKIWIRYKDKKYYFE